MKKIAFFIFLFLAGCGEVEWFPEQKTAGPNSPSAQPDIKTVPVGSYVVSVRTGARGYTVTTTRGAFATYTSLGVPFATAVSMETYTETVTGMLIGRTLRAGGNSVLVNEVLALVE